MSNESSKEFIAALRNQTRPEFLQFTKRNKLSAREADVLAALINRLISNDEIGDAMGLSPNTVSNHLKNIYAKTKTNNKTELMCYFADFCLNHLDKAKRYAKVPKILIVDDEPDICTLVSAALDDHELQIETANDVHSALEIYKSFNPDIVISDIKMPGLTGIDFIRKIKLEMKTNPLFFFITGYSEFTKEQCMAEGACDFIVKPFDFESLYKRIMENYIESADEKARYMGIDQTHFEQLSYRILRKFDTEKAEVGFGGVFLPAKQSLNKSVEKLMGAAIKFPIEVDDQKIDVLGEVSWVRPEDSSSLQAGIGVKFTLLSDKDKNFLVNFARENNAVAFIPLGTTNSHESLKTG